MDCGVFPFDKLWHFPSCFDREEPGVPATVNRCTVGAPFYIQGAGQACRWICAVQIAAPLISICSSTYSKIEIGGLP